MLKCVDKIEFIKCFKDAGPEIRKSAFAVFDEQKDRMRRYYQEGMLKSEDVPSSINMAQTKESLSIALKADLKEALETFAKTMVECLNGIENIFLDPMNLDEAELKTMDLILGSKLLLKFFMGLSRSDEGLMDLIEGLRVWECSAPMVKKDRLNALILALKNLKSPLMAATVVRMLREGLPSRLDQLIDHLTKTTVKTMGPLEVITIAPWQEISARSSLELVNNEEISSTSLVNPTPIATSSAVEISREISNLPTRAIMDRLKEQLQQASSSLDRV